MYAIFCYTIDLLLHILLVRVFQFSTNALGKHHTPITGVFNSPHGKWGQENLTLFINQINLFLYINKIQANEADSSTGMELLDFQKAFTFLLGTTIVIKSFISNCYTSIAEWTREECPSPSELGKPVIKHQFELLHKGKHKLVCNVLHSLKLISIIKLTLTNYCSIHHSS